MPTMRQNRTYDTLLLMKDAGAVTASAAAQVSGAAAVLDLAGSSASQQGWRGDELLWTVFDVIVDVTAIDVSSSDEMYSLVVEGCNTADFSTGSPVIVPLAILSLGHSSKIIGAGATSSTTGRYTIPAHNEFCGTVYRYVRMYHEISGTTPSINYTARAGIRMP